jgi:hypothetical protein
MGNDIGCGQGACCATDGNVDLQTQVETNHRAKQLLVANTTSAQSRNFEASEGNIDIGWVLSLPEGHKQRTQYDVSATKINALIKGFVQRIKYKKIYFMYLVTGKKAN